MNKFLYRGVNITIHDKGEGLKPKGLKFTREPQHGEQYLQHGNNLQHGKSIMNSIVAHQYNSTKFPSSGISTTTKFEIARKYATYNNQKGIVYKIDLDKCLELNIETYIVKSWIPYPQFPNDEEVILKDKDDNEINKLIIVEIIEVLP